MTATRRGVLQGLAAAALTPGLAQAAAGEPSLKEAAAKAGLFYGSNSESDIATAPAAYRALFVEQCALFGASLNWKDLAPTRDGADPAHEPANTRFAIEHGLDLTGGHLLWFESIPSWFAALDDPVQIQAAALSHIAAAVGHYKGQVFAWNVVNEALKPGDGRPDGLRQSLLLKRLGPDFFSIAFQAARRADPGAFLVYNDYDLEMDRPDHEAKRTALLHLLDRFAADEAPVDAVGLQSHLALDGSSRFDEKRYRAFLAELASRKLRIIISELDVVDVAAPTDHAARDQAVADLYARFLATALDERAVMAVVTWGLSDRYTWLIPSNSPKYARADGEAGRPLPFDDAFAPKPAFDAVRRAFEQAPIRDAARRRDPSVK
jgi:endo-1,4-beta-xylanase